MIAEKAADIVRDKDTVRAIKEYFRHLMEIKHKKIMEEEEIPHNRTGDKEKKWRHSIVDGPTPRYVTLVEEHQRYSTSNQKMTWIETWIVRNKKKLELMS